jgi:hypothetical protein
MPHFALIFGKRSCHIAQTAGFRHRITLRRYVNDFHAALSLPVLKVVVKVLRNKLKEYLSTKRRIFIPN